MLVSIPENRSDLFRIFSTDSDFIVCLTALYSHFTGAESGRPTPTSPPSIGAPSNSSSTPPTHGANARSAKDAKVQCLWQRMYAHRISVCGRVALMSSRSRTKAMINCAGCGRSLLIRDGYAGYATDHVPEGAVLKYDCDVRVPRVTVGCTCGVFTRNVRHWSEVESSRPSQQ